VFGKGRYICSAQLGSLIPDLMQCSLGPFIRLFLYSIHTLGGMVPAVVHNGMTALLTKYWERTILGFDF